MLKSNIKMIVLAGVATILAFGCEQFQGKATPRADEPIIIIDSAVKGMIPSQNIQGVIDVKLTKYEDLRRLDMVSKGQAIFLEKPVNKDARVIVEDLPNDYDYAMMKEAGTLPKITKGMKPKEKYALRTQSKRPGRSAEIKPASSYNGLKIKLFSGQAASGNEIQSDSIPETLSFSLDQSKGLLVMKESSSSYDPDEMAQKGANLSAKIMGGLVPEDKSPKAKSVKIDGASLSFPAQFFEPTDADKDAFDPLEGITLDPNIEAGIPITWSTQAASSGTFVTIRIFVIDKTYNPSKPKGQVQFKKRLFIDCPDTGSYTLAQKTLQQIAGGTDDEALMFIWRVKPQTFAMSKEEAAKPKPAALENEGAESEEGANASEEISYAEEAAPAPADTPAGNNVALFSIGTARQVVVKAVAKQ